MLIESRNCAELAAVILRFGVRIDKRVAPGGESFRHGLADDALKGRDDSERIAACAEFRLAGWQAIGRAARPAQHRIVNRLLASAPDMKDAKRETGQFADT